MNKINAGQPVKYWRMLQNKSAPKLGWFQAWGTYYEEFENGIGNFPAAVILDNDGKTIHVIPADFMSVDE